MKATVSVTPGQLLLVYVGGPGSDTASNYRNPNSGGFNGGGNVITGETNAAGGGGATDIRTTIGDLSSRLVVAGGGGGGVSWGGAVPSFGIGLDGGCL